MTIRRFLAAAIVLAIAVGARPDLVAALNETPGSDYAIILQPFRGQPGFWDDAQFAVAALDDQGYSVERLFDTSLDGYPTSKLSDFVEGLGNRPGAVVFSTHGDAGSFVVESYGYNDQATMLAAYNAYLAAGYSVGEIAWTVDPNPPAYCGIVIEALGLSQRFDGANTIVYGAACGSGILSNMWTGSRCVLGYPNVCTYNQVIQDYSTFWPRLDGESGKPNRVVAAAVVGTGLSLYGNGATVLAPTVAAFWPPVGATVECGDSGFVSFDAAMKTSAGASVAVYGAVDLYIDGVSWIAPDRIRFTLHPCDYGPVAVRLRAWTLTSANSSGLYLDGNQTPYGTDGRGPSEDDFEWTLESSCYESKPVAWLDEVVWRGDEVRWHALSESGTEAYRLSGADALTGAPWTPASETIGARGSDARYALRPSLAFPFYRVEERDRAGESERWNADMPVAAREMPQPRARAGRASDPRAVAVWAPERMRGAAEAYREARATLGLATIVNVIDRSPAVLFDALDEDEAARAPSASLPRVWGQASVPGPETHVAPAANDLAILYPIALDATGAVSAYAADKEALGWNVSTRAWPAVPALTAVAAVVESLKIAGADAILLLGAVRDGNASGTTMPATMEPDSFSSFTDFSLRSETILSLWDYERDLVTSDRIGPWVGYVPLESAGEAWTFAEKMADYEWNGSYRSNWDNFSSWGWDVPLGSNSPAQVVAHVDSAVALVPPSWERESLWGSQVPAGSGWSQMAAASLNAGQGVVLALATGSAPDNPCHWLNAGADVFDAWTDLSANFKTPLFLALSCGSAQIDAVDPEDLPVVARDLLIVPDRGIIGAIGPTRGFYEHYYGEYARTFWELYASGRYAFVGDLHRAARNQLLDEAPADPMMALFCRMAILVGDPTTTLPGVDLDALTAVASGEGSARLSGAPWLGPPAPNPFNPRVRIAFDLPRRADATLRVFEPSGRRVATLATGRQEAGPHVVEWDGRDHARRDVGSGIYLFELSTEGRRLVRRGTLLR